MESENQQLLESLMPEMDSQSILNFSQNNFGFPEQMFADSSSSETCIEEVIIGPDITTSDANNQAVAVTEMNKKITSAKILSSQGISQQLAAPGLSNPPNNVPPLRIAAVPVNSEVFKQGNNKLFLIPMGEMDTSLLQSNLNVPAGQNIIIVKPQDLINSVEEKKLKLKTQHGMVLQQTKNTNQDKVVNKKQSDQVTLVQPQPNVQAHAPISLVNSSQANVKSNVVVEDNQINQPRKENQVGANLQANQGPAQPKIIVKMLNTLEGVNSKLGNLEPQQVTQSIQKSEMATPKHISLSKNVPTNEAPAYSRTSQSQPVVKVSQQIQMKTAPETAGKLNMANPGIQAQKVVQSLPVTAIVIEAQKSISSTTVGATSCRPLNKVSQGIQTCQNKETLLSQPKAKTTPVKSVNKVSQGVQTVPQKMQLGQSKAILQVPRSFSKTSFSKVTHPTTQCNTESKIKFPLHQTQNLPQATLIVRPTNQAAATQGKTNALFFQASAEKIPSSTPVAAPKLQSHTPSVWPSTKQFVVNLESSVIDDKPKRGRPPKSESSTAEKSKITKTDSQKGPTLLTELEKRGSSFSIATRMKTARTGESQLKPIKQTKVNSTNPWRCSLCGKSSFENSLGCLFGPYDENKDASQAEAQTPGRKRKHNSTSDETESPTKSKPESNSTQEFWFHGDCIVWSPGVYVVGESLAGYKQAVNDSRFRKCISCGNFGASLVCLQRTCKKLYHFPCSKEAECIFDDSNYTMQCGHHK